MTTVLVPNSSCKFCCTICDYNTSRKSQYNRHLLTTKHLETTKRLQKTTDLVPNCEYICSHCNKAYKHHSSLWKHKNTCQSEKLSPKTQEPDNTDMSYLTNMVLEVIKSNNELQKQNQDFQLQIMEHYKNSSNTMISNSNVNSNNKTFNMNVFLNEHCKDAMNISEFVDSIKLGFNDLVNVGKVGYVEGISGIIIKRLRELDIHKRPMHCGDEKRHSMYIKEDGKWEKDESDNKKLKKLIKQVAFRNTKNTVLFKEKYPDCSTSASKYSDQYNKIVLESYGGRGDNDAEKENKIIRMIAKAVYIDKSL